MTLEHQEGPRLSSAVRDDVGRQDYTPQTRIEGVRLEDLRRFTDDGGNFQELLRLDDAGIAQAFPGFQVRQVNYSLMEPGTIKAWHLHENQEDIWFVPPEMRLLVGLLDCRDGSPTEGQTMRLVLGAGHSRLLYIPRGVAHGAANLGKQPAAILYFVNQQFDHQRPDELRLPWDHVGTDFWQLHHG